MRADSLHIRVDSDIKKEAEYLFNSMGLTTADAVNIFLHQAVNTHSIPFPIKGKRTKEEIQAEIVARVEAAEAEHADGTPYLDGKATLAELRAKYVK